MLDSQFIHVEQFICYFVSVFLFIVRFILCSKVQFYTLNRYKVNGFW